RSITVPHGLSYATPDCLARKVIGRNQSGLLVYAPGSSNSLLRWRVGRYGSSAEAVRRWRQPPALISSGARNLSEGSLGSRLRQGTASVVLFPINPVVPVYL